MCGKLVKVILSDIMLRNKLVPPKGPRFRKSKVSRVLETLNTSSPQYFLLGDGLRVRVELTKMKKLKSLQAQQNKLCTLQIPWSTHWFS